MYVCVSIHLYIIEGPRGGSRPSCGSQRPTIDMYIYIYICITYIYIYAYIHDCTIVTILYHIASAKVRRPGASCIQCARRSPRCSEKSPLANP